MKKHVIVNLVLVIAILAGAGAGASWLIRTLKKPDARPPRRLVPKVRALEIGLVENYQVRIVGYGSARPKVQLVVTPQVTGLVVKKAPNYDSDRNLTKGQILFQIDPTDYVIARDSVRRDIERLETRIKRLTQEQDNLRKSMQIETDRRALAKRQLDKARQLLASSAAGQDDVDAAEEALLVRKGQIRTIENLLNLIPTQRNHLNAEINAVVCESLIPFSLTPVDTVEVFLIHQKI